MSTVLLILCAGQVLAQDKKEAKEGGGELAAKTQNPVGAMYSLPLKFTFDYGADNGEATFLNINPVIPVTFGDWNLINRVLMPLIDTPGLVTGTPEIPNPVPGDAATGLVTSVKKEARSQRGLPGQRQEIQSAPGWLQLPALFPGQSGEGSSQGDHVFRGQRNAQRNPC